GGDLAAAGTATVTVVNPAPGGGTSGGASFTISALAPGCTLLTNGVSLTGQSVVQNAFACYGIVVPGGATNLVVTMSGGTGDADLYVRFGSQPTLGSYDCR